MIDMLTILIVGNSSTFVSDGVIITPRGYGLSFSLRGLGRP